jgi:hypothetical protein
MADMLERIALVRESDQDAAKDDRYALAAANLRLLASTMSDVSDDLLQATAALNDLTAGLLSALISARLLAIGFEVAPYADAAAFYESLIDIADRAKRHRLN